MKIKPYHFKKHPLTILVPFLGMIMLAFESNAIVIWIAFFLLVGLILWIAISHFFYWQQKKINPPK